VGRSLLQSREEWAERNRVLAETMAGLVRRHAEVQTGEGVDVGCQTGRLTDAMQELTPFDWQGIDPALDGPSRSPNGRDLSPGFAHAMPFESGQFDVALFANVYEHVDPDQRLATLQEIGRVLRPGGTIVGQLPNPYFPIESHSRLPFMGWLPVRAQKVYWRVAPVTWEHDFHVVTIRHVRQTALRAGLEVVTVSNFTYPPEVVPESVRWIAKAMQRPMRLVPWAWQFVLRRPAA
jgi:SAM-dependent methyltransferase